MWLPFLLYIYIRLFLLSKKSMMNKLIYINVLKKTLNFKKYHRALIENECKTIEYEQLH